MAAAIFDVFFYREESGAAIGGLLQIANDT